MWFHSPNSLIFGLSQAKFFPLFSIKTQHKIISLPHLLDKHWQDYCGTKNKQKNPSHPNLGYGWSSAILSTPGNSTDEPKFGNCHLGSQNSFTWIFGKQNPEIMGKPWPLD